MTDVSCVLCVVGAMACRLLLGLGLFYLSVSLVPVSFAGLLRLAGFLLNRSRGVRYLDTCANHVDGVSERL